MIFNPPADALNFSNQPYGVQGSSTAVRLDGTIEPEASRAVMAAPTIIDIPHTLGRDEARRRMEAGIGKLASHIPGGAATVTHSWPSQDQLSLTVATMGVEVPCSVDAEDAHLRVTLQLPAMLSLMSGPIKAIVQQQGERLLLDKKSDQTA